MFFIEVETHTALFETDVVACYQAICFLFLAESNIKLLLLFFRLLLSTYGLEDIFYLGQNRLTDRLIAIFLLLFKLHLVAIVQFVLDQVLGPGKLFELFFHAPVLSWLHGKTFLLLSPRYVVSLCSG